MKNSAKAKQILFFAVVSAGLLFSFSAKAVTTGEIKKFYVDPYFDYSGRTEISASLVLETDKLYFYIDNSWWQSLYSGDKNDILTNLSNLSTEFQNKIYPILSVNYGEEWNPGIDSDSKITVLIHPMKKSAGGYFNPGNEYLKIQFPFSNEREMVYINSDFASDVIIKQLLTHEFTHLITFNQKDHAYGVEEDVWLNEARAEYAIALCGYNDNYSGSNLQKRVMEFLKNPTDSLTDWDGVSSDYGALDIFIQYLVDQYGVKILNDSLHSNKIGIDSINYAFAKNGFSKNFSDVFSDWTIAVLVNNCSLGQRYCYKNESLKNLKVIPNDFIFSNGGVSILKYSIYNWAGNWQKISSQVDNISFELSGFTSTDFRIFYILCDNAGKCEIRPTESKDGNLSLNDFKNKYIVLVSSLESDFIKNAQITLTIKSFENVSKAEEDLLAGIEYLKKEIIRLQAQLDVIKNNKNASNNACEIKNDLFFGITGNSEVICLQQFLKNQGIDIYPEGLVTGNFLTLTNNAVIKFQEKYIDEILKPLGLNKGTGYVGEMTKKKINEMLK
jgi:hypothetical protein